MRDLGRVFHLSEDSAQVRDGVFVRKHGLTRVEQLSDNGNFNHRRNAALRSPEFGAQQHLQCMQVARRAQ